MEVPPRCWLRRQRDVQLSGIIVREARPGWVSMELPAQEAWREPMRWLRPEQRERIESPEFYQMLQQQLGQRFLALRST